MTAGCALPPRARRVRAATPRATLDLVARALVCLLVLGAASSANAQALDDVRTQYSWQAVGQRIQTIYQKLAGNRPDTNWLALYDPAQVTVDSADADCRFRAQPHLL